VAAAIVRPRCEVELAESAVEDLRGILAWYLSQHVPEVGANMVVAIIEHVERLAVLPDSGRVAPEFETPWLREVHDANVCRPPPWERMTKAERGGRSWVTLNHERLMDPKLAEDS